jgi:arabinogalactan endo-1,4-beta-galactosidase
LTAAAFAEEPSYVLGADISWIPQREAEKVKYAHNGQVRDMLDILKEHKFNYIRLRLFVDPTAKVPEDKPNSDGWSASPYSTAGYCGLASTVAMAKRVKAAGMGLLLDFHYSDTWADPGKQYKPVSWRDLNSAQLIEKVRSYTKESLLAFKEAGALPDIVQVGNEVVGGMVHPDGKDNGAGFAALVNAGIKGVKDLDPNIKIMMHTINERNPNGWVSTLKANLNKLEAGAADKIDVIGLSYYPRWHGNVDSLKRSLTAIANSHNYKVAVAEYADKHREVNDVVFNLLPANKRFGTFVWEPEEFEGDNSLPLFDWKNGRRETNARMALYPIMAKDYGIDGAGTTGILETKRELPPTADIASTQNSKSQNSKAQTGAMQVENLNRGLIAIRVGQGYYLSWRLLANEPYTTGFNVYRGTTKLNSAPITGATVYTDAGGALNSVYTVRAVAANGAERATSDAAIIINNTDGPNSNNTSGESAGYIQIDLQRPATGAQGGTYSPGDGSTGDLDGDGVYDIVLKWDPDNAKDNSQSGTTDNVLIDAYTLAGKRLWRIDLGQNIRAGAHYTQFLVFDFDGDGKAEVIMKTAPGTKDGTGTFIKTGPAANASHSTAYRNADGYVLSGPEYITIFEGATGKELATIDYWPARGTVNSWGDNYGNRVDRFNAVVAYLDGERPSAVFQRGYYTRMTFLALDWRGGKLTERWRFDSGASGNGSYAGQGNHQLSVADVDTSGKHSIITGAAVIGPDGKGKHTTGWGHGDALHVAHMIKGAATPQIFMPHEDKSTGHGVLLRHANNGASIFNVPKADTDVGRGAAAELDPASPGFKFWAASSMGLYDINGKVISSTLPNNGNNTGVCNFVVWWDGDLSRELLDGNQITKWSVTRNQGTRLLTAYGASSVNGTKSTPVLQADLFGDWREEVVLAYGNSALRIYTTTSPTTHRLVTMMHDPTYRCAVAWQNSSYNQPPHPGYYIASDMSFPPPALNVAVVGGDSDTSGGPTPVKGADAAVRGGNYSLRVVRVNGGTIDINYSIGANGRVRLEMFDMKGGRVRTIINSAVKAGSYKERLTTDGLAAGMYFVRLQSDNAVLRERVQISR